MRLKARSRAALAVGVLASAACSPTLDWRDARPEGSGAMLLLPCRPSAQTRSVTLAGSAVRLALHACSAGGATWALAFTDVQDPALVVPALVALRNAAAANLGAAAADIQPLALSVSGATPNAASGRQALRGRLPDGSAVQEQVAVFARGTVVYQATVVGASVPADGADTFFGSIRAGS